MLTLIVLPLLISAVAGILVSLFVENARMPVLGVGEPHEVRIGMTSNGVPNGEATSFRLRVENRAPSRFLSRFLQRQTARACHARISFISCDGNALALPSMEGRWANSIPPAPLFGWIGDHREDVTLYDPSRFDAASRIDIAPGASEVLDVAVHLDGDSHPFGWTNTSYQFGGRHPTYALNAGVHVLEVSVATEGIAVTRRVTMTIGHLIAPATNPTELPGAGAHFAAPIRRV